MSDEGKRYADAINGELLAIVEGRMWSDDKGNNVVATFDEMKAKYGEDFDIDYEQVSLGEWMSNSVYDVRYLVEQDKSYRSCMLMLAGGGPTVWLNTENGMIEFDWGGDPTEYYRVTYGVCDEIDEYVADAMF